MSRNASRASASRPRKKSRGKSLLWIVGVSAIVIVLLWQEQIALLYLLATVSMAVLLIVVAMADLHYGERPAVENIPYDDSAAISDGSTGVVAPTSKPPASPSWGATSSRTTKARRRK